MQFDKDYHLGLSVLSVVLTGHKMQAKTFEAIILGYLPKHHFYGSSGWIYVILSRVRKLSHFYTLTWLDTDTRKYKPQFTLFKKWNACPLSKKLLFVDFKRFSINYSNVFFSIHNLKQNVNSLQWNLRKTNKHFNSASLQKIFNFTSRNRFQHYKVISTMLRTCGILLLQPS